MKFLCKLWLDYIKPVWSKIRWKKINSILPTQTNLLKAKSIRGIQEVCDTLYKHYRWKMDDVSELLDTYRPIGYLYNWYINSLNKDSIIVEDDCDGFHSIVYHILKSNNIQSCLLTIATRPITNSHTMTLFRYEGDIYLIDYNVLYKYSADKTIQSIVDDYNTRNKYKPEHYWTTHEYNYDKRLFYKVEWK